MVNRTIIKQLTSDQIEMTYIYRKEYGMNFEDIRKKINQNNISSASSLHYAYNNIVQMFQGVRKGWGHQYIIAFERLKERYKNNPTHSAVFISDTPSNAHTVPSAGTLEESRRPLSHQEQLMDAWEVFQGKLQRYVEAEVGRQHEELIEENRKLKIVAEEARKSNWVNNMFRGNGK